MALDAARPTPDLSTTPIRFVAATRRDADGFMAETLLGRTLSLHCAAGVDLALAPRNAEGLPAVYNRAIEAARDRPAILVFIHDDVALTDFFWAAQIRAAASVFDVAGVAGNRRRAPRQPSWAFVDEDFAVDAPENLSGVVGHGDALPPRSLNVYGPPGQAVKLLDGMILIARSETLHATGLRFDERFAFHFYDLDFCREAEARGLSMGTWALSALHASGGAFGVPAWRAGWAAYLDKWGA